MRNMQSTRAYRLPATGHPPLAVRLMIVKYLYLISGSSFGLCRLTKSICRY